MFFKPSKAPIVKQSRFFQKLFLSYDGIKASDDEIVRIQQKKMNERKNKNLGRKSPR